MRKEVQPAFPPPIDDPNNDIAAEQSQESVVEEQYEMSNLDAVNPNGASSVRLTATAALCLAVIGSMFARPLF